MSYRSPLSRFRKALALAASTAMLVTAGSVLIAGPAQAAAPCASGQSGPYWWAAEKATTDRDERVVLAIDSPWGANSPAYIWNYNDDNRQKWCLQRLGFLSNGEPYWRFRYANDTSLCLDADSSSNLARLRLKTCSTTGSLQSFWRNHTGSYTDPENGTSYSTYQWKTVAGDKCLDVKDAGSGDGTHVILFTCLQSNLNQRWY